MDNECLICDRIQLIKDNNNPCFVAELETGYVVIGDFQFYKGYTLFLCKEHVSELHELELKFRRKFLEEMSLVAEAAFRVFQPKKMNYELLGNTDRHLHWHLFPRYETDPEPKNMPVWLIDKSIRSAESTRPAKEELENLKNKLKVELELVLALRA